jgi:hypothetical protein
LIFRRLARLDAPEMMLAQEALEQVSQIADGAAGLALDPQNEGWPLPQVFVVG